MSSFLRRSPKFGSALFPALLAFLFSSAASGETAIEDNGVAESLAPAPRQANYEWMSLGRWYQLHSEDVELAADGDSPLLFIGDSITEGWQLDGLPVWDEHFAPRGAVDFGIGGDMTQNLLWRLDNGAVGKLQPRAVVLLIGINNTYFIDDTPQQISQGIVATVDALQAAFPEADILLQAVFPMGEKPGNPIRAEVRQINSGISHLGQREKVTFVDLESVFLEEDGRISADIMPDYLHLSEAGYRRWAQAILPWVDERVPMPESAAANVSDELPHAFKAGWKGQDTCELLYDGPAVRIGKCEFPPGIGHEKHYHNPHFGYTLEGGTFQMIDAEGSRTLPIPTGSSWTTEERTEHEAINVGETTGRYLIVEPRPK